MLAESTLVDGRNLLIAHVEPIDAAEIVAYIDQVSGESDNLTLGAGEFRMSVEDEMKFIEGLDGGKFSFMLKGVVDRRIVSLCSIERRMPTRFRHNGNLALSVVASHWNLGIGKRMCLAALSQARQVGVTKVNLHVRGDNLIAIRLYESVGFRSEGLITRRLKIGDRYFDERAMGICLD